MRQHRSRRHGLIEREPVLLVDQNVFDRAIAVGAQPLRAKTGRFEAVGAVDPAEPHQAETRAIALFRMRPALEHAGHEPAGRRAGLCRPGDQP